MRGVKKGISREHLDPNKWYQSLVFLFLSSYADSFNEPWTHINVGTKVVCSLLFVQVHRGNKWKMDSEPNDQQGADRANPQTKPFLILESFTFVVVCMFSGRTDMGSGRS